MDTTKTTDSNPSNRDPLTKEPGSHPVGTGLGSAGGAAAGVAIGAAIGGPSGPSSAGRSVRLRVEPQDTASAKR